jgi:hypothetical protein
MNPSVDGRPDNNRHLTEEQLTDAYYGNCDPPSHLSSCTHCREEFDRLSETLNTFHEFPIPARGAEYGSTVWTRLLPKLVDEPARREKMPWRRWLLVPVFATLLIAAFLGGRLTERKAKDGISEKSRERVLMMALNEHLERSQIVLANVAHASSTEEESLTAERDRAHELLGANRLLRQTALQLGDAKDAALLDDLERVLLSVANSDALEHTKRQIEREGLLFRVRVTSAASGEKGEKL